MRFQLNVRCWQGNATDFIERTNRESLFHRACLITCTTLLIIGALGAAGVLSCPTVGWVTLGLGAGALVFNLARGRFQERQNQLIIFALSSIAMTVVGALGGAGVLSGAQVGWGAIGSLLSVVALSGC